MNNKRKQYRRKTYAKVVFSFDGTPGYMRDLSRNGCKISFIKPVGVSLKEIIELKIIPQQEASTPAFRIFLEVRWIQIDSVFFLIGGVISLLPEEEDEQRFTKLLAFYMKER